MLRRFLFGCMIVLGLADAARAASAAPGLTGLGEMRTPATVGDRSEIFFFTRYKLINEDIGRRITPALGYTYGIGEHMETGLVLPFHSMEGGSSLGNVPLLFKYRFLDGDLLNFAGTVHVDVPAASKGKQFGSGSPGFGAELDGSLTFGALDLVGSLEYGKGDYCPRCDYAGLQRGPDGVFVPILKVAGGLAYGDADYRAYAELHFENAANGDQNGIAGDPDAYALVGGRYAFTPAVAAGGYAGAGVVGEKSNTKVLATLMVHYTLGAGEAEAEPEAAAPAPKAPEKPAVKIEIIDACAAPQKAKDLAAKLGAKGLEARFAGSSSQRMNESAIYFTDAGVAAGSEIAREMQGKQKMFKQQALPGGAAVRVYTGCDYGAPPPAPKPQPKAAPAAPKKAKSAINVAVVNGCGKPGLAEDAAKTLLLGGFNVTQIYDEPKQTTPGLTEVRFREAYKAEAGEIAAKLPGRQRLFVDRSLPADVDIRVVAGCAQ